MSALPLPVIGVPACVREFHEMPFHTVSDRYVNCVVSGVGGLPLLVPAAGSGVCLDTLLASLDGLLFTGSPSNVEPHHYGGPVFEGTLHDPCRDATTLPLIRAAIAAAVPVFAICRGHQELNVALGGTLHQLVHELPGRIDHRSSRELPRAHRADPRHLVRLTPGGFIARLAGGAAEVMVNSLHAQAIDRVADGLIVEAVAADGTIEAVRVKDAPAFALGVQWHPEARLAEDALSHALFTAFGDATRARAVRRQSATAGRAA